MNQRIKELSEQLIAASAAFDITEVKRLSKEIAEITKPPSFSDSWNYENKTPEPEKGSFSDHWNFSERR